MARPHWFLKGIMLEVDTVTLCGRALDQPGHICAFFDSRDEAYETLLPYFNEGMRHGEQIISIVDASARREHIARLEASGISVNDAIATDDLRILTAEETYTSGGRFAVERMYGLVQHTLAEAKTKDRRVRASGMMDWVERHLPGTERLVEYEGRLNVLVPAYECTLLCAYDLAKISGKVVMDVLATHPYVIFGQTVHENTYYVPPVIAPTLKLETRATQH